MHACMFVAISKQNTCAHYAHYTHHALSTLYAYVTSAQIAQLACTRISHAHASTPGTQTARVRVENPNRKFNCELRARVHCWGPSGWAIAQTPESIRKIHKVLSISVNVV